MKIKKFDMNNKENKLLYKVPEDGGSEASDFKISFSLERILPDQALSIGSDRLSSAHVATAGMLAWDKGPMGKGTAGQAETFTCEEEERIQISGDGQMLSMTMGGGVRGFIRLLEMEAGMSMEVGEGVGASVVALVPVGGGCRMEYSGEALVCEDGCGLIMHLENREFHSLKLIPEHQNVKLISASGVFLSPYDFGKYVGVHFVERGEGYCRARLDIRQEHMNPIGTVHGGCLFTLADAACGIAASSTGGICTTVTSNIQFLNAAFRPQYLMAEAKPVKLGRKVRNFLVEIWDDKGLLICRVDFIFYSLRQ